MKRVAINGFGRIGRAFLRIAQQRSDLEVVAVNDILLEPDLAAYLLKFDSVYRRFPGTVCHNKEGLLIDGRPVALLAKKDPAALPWKTMNVDVVIESTGVFRTKDKARLHLDAGAKKVVISAPAKGGDVPTFVYGVNHETYNADQDHVISAASCTTNCLAPLVYILNREFGLERGLMTTVHAYTAGQGLVDSAQPNDWGRGRAAAQNIVPTTTGAASAVGLVLPELNGKLDGMALRVPTATGSVTDLTVTLQKETTVEQINDAFRRYADGTMEGVLAVSDVPIVSSDCVGDAHSSIVDLGATNVLGGTLAKVLSFYDNEWGYTNRLVDLAGYL